MRRWLLAIFVLVLAMAALGDRQALAYLKTTSTGGVLRSSTALDYQQIEKVYDSPGGQKIQKAHLTFTGRPASIGATHTNDDIYLYYRTCPTCGWSYYGSWTSALNQDFWVDLGAYNATGIKVRLSTSSSPAQGGGPVDLSVSCHNCSVQSQQWTAPQTLLGARIRTSTERCCDWGRLYGWDSNSGAWMEIGRWSGTTDTWVDLRPFGKITRLYTHLTTDGSVLSNPTYIAVPEVYYAWGVPTGIGPPPPVATADAPEVGQEVPPYTPGKPTLTSNSNVAYHQQVVSWTAANNPAGTTYELWRRTYNASGTQTADERIYYGTATTFTTTDQAPGRYYRYRVRAAYSGLTSDFSAETAYWTASAPSGVTQGTNSLTVTWPQVYPSLTYRLHWKKDAGSWISVNTTQTSYTLSSLQPGSRYYFAMSPLLPEGGTEWWQGDGSRPYSPLYPAPGGVKAENITTSGATVKWYAGSIPTGATIRVARGGSQVWQGTPSYSHQYDSSWGYQYVARWTDSGLAAGSPYTYSVCAVNVLGDCGPGTSTSLTTVPATPASLSGNNGGLGWSRAGRGWVTLKWATSRGATGYKVWVFDGNSYRAFDVGNATSWDSRAAKIYPSDNWISSKCNNCVSSDPFNHNASGLDLRDNPNPLYLKTAGTTYDSATNYWFRVSAYNASGDSGTGSAVYTPTLPDQTDMAAPAGVTVQVNAGASQTGGSRVKVAVAASDDKSGLSTVQLSNDSSTWTTVATLGGLSGSTTVDWALDSSGFGTKTVYGRVSDVAGNWSAAVSARILYMLTDSSSPVVTLLINGGTVSTDRDTVTLGITATDDQTPQSMLRMRFSNDGRDWSAWENYAPTRTWGLRPAGGTVTEGRKEVWVEVQDTAGNAGSAVANVFYRATILPGNNSSVFWSTTGNQGNFSTGTSTIPVQFTRLTQVTVNWNTSGLAGVRTVRYGFDLNRMSGWETLQASRNLLLGPAQGVQTLYGQLDDGRVFQVNFVLDTEAPEVTAEWKGGATVTGPGGSAAILVAAQDNVARAEDLQMSVNGSAWVAWVPDYSLALGGSGPASVVIRVRDPAGNVTTHVLQIHVLQ